MTRDQSTRPDAAGRADGTDEPGSDLSMSDETTLDPENWDHLRALAHRMLDTALDQVEGVRDGPVWRPVPPEIQAALRAPLPHYAEGPQAVCDDLIDTVLPYPTGNQHPRFFGWVHGAGTPMGIIAEMMAAAMNANLGGRQHGAVFVERQVIDWCRQLFGFPSTASGLVVTGTSMANIVGLAVARHHATGGMAAADGLGGRGAALVGYTSAEAHGSVAKAFELLGLGSRYLREIPVDSEFRMDLGRLAEAIEADRAAGLQPFCVIGTAGTVNTGAIDDLSAIADLCARHELWFHLDGAFGALAMLSEKLRPRLAGIDRVDSLAFDFHKWMHVPYDAGCVLVRDGALHRETFSRHGPYLTSARTGLAGGEPWFCDFGPELSRGFRALKVWATFKTFGVTRLGQSIWSNCRLAGYLADRIRDHARLQLLAPVSLAIVCFRFTDPALSPDALDEVNDRIVSELQNSGVAAPSTTRLGGRLAIRVNITNHRTRRADIDQMLDAVIAVGGAQAASAAEPERLQAKRKTR